MEDVGRAPFEIEMQSEGAPARRWAFFFFSHINMCLSGPSPPSGGGPQHQMEPRLALCLVLQHLPSGCVPLSAAVIYMLLLLLLDLKCYQFYRLQRKPLKTVFKERERDDDGK